MPILRLRDENGKWFEVPAIAGKTPVRGDDYWTPEDVASIKAYIDAAVANAMGAGGTATATLGIARLGTMKLGKN